MSILLQIRRPSNPHANDENWGVFIQSHILFIIFAIITITTVVLMVRHVIKRKRGYRALVSSCTILGFCLWISYGADMTVISFFLLIMYIVLNIVCLNDVLTKGP